jgi:PilZ domain
LRRLREHQLVMMEIERPNASIECLVLAIDGNDATLQPVEAAEAALVPPEGKDVLLSFEFRSQLVVLRGSGRRDEGTGELHFAVTDRVMVPQRRHYARVDVALPVKLTPAGEGTAPSDPIESQTRDLSADGILLDELLPPAHSEWRIELSLPEEGAPLTSDARVVRQVAGGTAMRFSNIAADDRDRLKRFVAQRKRAILQAVRKREA